jgi:uncharacterized lipoprotein
MALPALVLASGCHIFSMQPDCHKPQQYQKARQVAPLRVPEGLDAPNVTGALSIPAADEVTPPPLGPKDACLDAPPRFRESPPSKSAAEMPKAGGAP